MSEVAASGLSKPRPFLATKRKDAWWVSPLLTFLGFSAFIVYATWAALQGNHYTYGPYLSPFYAPEIFGNSPHAWFGPPPSWWPYNILPFSPAMLILWAPGGFRFTCYYYRGAYYKAFWGDPPSCAVGEPRKSYLGERYLPLVLQNVHRYFMYLAVIFIFMLAYDVFKATQFENGFGVGVGTLVLATNVVLLASYTFGCHSLRHLVGGRKDQLPKGVIGKNCYNCVSGLNKRHMIFAWCSLFSVGLSDVYVRLCSMGVIHDFRIF
jgi:hypothetical protein